MLEVQDDVLQQADGAGDAEVERLLGPTVAAAFLQHLLPARQGRRDGSSTV